MSTLTARLAAAPRPRVVGHVDVPAGTWEKLTGGKGQASRAAGWNPDRHPRIPGGRGGGRFTSAPGGGRGRKEAGPWSRAGDVVTYHGNMGVDRAEMPQLSGAGHDGVYHPSAEMVPKFMAYLRSQGIHVQERRVAAASLKPTQTTGDMRAIRGLADSLKSGELADTKPITVSLDHRVLDGHHNWAGRLLADAEGGRKGLGHGMRVVQVGVPMKDLLDIARQWSESQGIKPRATGVAGNPKFARPPVSVRAAVAGHHVPGTPYEWEHGYDPLTLAAAKSHFKNRVPPHWTPPGSLGPERTGGKMKHGDMHDGYQAVGPAPVGILGGEHSRHVSVPGEEHTHHATGSYSDPWWMTKPGGGWAVSRRWQHKAQTSHDWSGPGHQARTVQIPAADERVLTPVDATGVPLDGGFGGGGDRTFPLPSMAAANATARAKATGQVHYVTQTGAGRHVSSPKRPTYARFHQVSPEGEWKRREFSGMPAGALAPSGPPGAPEVAAKAR